MVLSWLGANWREPRFVIACAAILLLVCDTFWKPISPIGLGLLMVALLPWFFTFVRELEIPGGIKINFREKLDEATEKAAEAGLLQPEVAQGPNQRPYQEVFASDPVLALAGLRIELERSLRELQKSYGFSTSGRGYSLSRVVQELRQNGILSPEEASALADVVPLLNAAVHSQEFSREAASWAMTVGPQLVAAIKSKQHH